MYTTAITDVLSNLNIACALILLSSFALFAYFCIYERDDIKKVFEKFEAGVIAVWTVVRNPINLVGFITVAILVNAFPHLLKEIGGAVLKSQKLN